MFAAANCKNSADETINRDPPHVFACKKIRHTHVKDLAALVRVRWIMETLNNPASVEKRNKKIDYGNT